MTALEKFLKQIVLKKVKGSVYLVPAICDSQIEEALEEERKQMQIIVETPPRTKFFCDCPIHEMDRMPMERSQNKCGSCGKPLEK